MLLYVYTYTEIAPAEFLENFIFPVLLPGLEATLRTAKHTEVYHVFTSVDNRRS